MKLEGRGTFENSPCVKEFVQRMMHSGHEAFVLDLEKCEMMDSTFMGTLASVAFRLREKSCGQLRVIRANERNTSLLESLGLDHLFELQTDPLPDAPEVLSKAGLPQAGPDERRESILVAHEALVEADPRNAVRFQDVIDYLRQDGSGGAC